jgi:hypothetical protein
LKHEEVSANAQEPSASALEHQIEALRSELGDLVGELDRRRHEVMDVRLQLRRHPRILAFAVAAVGLIVAGRVVLRRRSPSRLSGRALNLARVLGVLSKEDPSTVRRAIRRRPTAMTALGAAAKLLGGVVVPSGRGR